MQRQLVTQKEFLEACDAGKKEFSDALMQFFDISDAKFSGISIRDSKLMFCTFRNCTFKDVVFDKCTIYFGSFYSGELTGTAFDNCRIEVTLFDNMQFKDAAMKRCSLSWNGILNSNLPDMSTSSHFKTITDLSQLTPSDIVEVVKNVMRGIERLDVGLRLKIKEMIRQDADRYRLSLPDEAPGKYEGHKAYEKDAPLSYGEVRGMIESVFFYASRSPYKSKKPYETRGPYKS